MKGQLNVMRLSAARQMSDAVGSVGDHCRKFLCQVNHLLDLVNGRDNLGKVLFLIYFSHLCYQIGGNAMPKFLDSVNTCSFKKLRKLRTDALHTEEVCMVYPSEDEAAIDSGGLLKGLASLCGLAHLKKLVNGRNAGCREFLRISRANTLNVDNVVGNCEIS